MKKLILIFILVASIIVLGACNAKEEAKNEATNEGTNEEVTNEEKVNETDSESDEKETTDIDEKEESVENSGDQKQLFDIQLNSESSEIQLLSPDGKMEVLATDMPSKPVKSPDNQKAVYISPHGWETLGSLYLVDLVTGEQEELVPTEEENTPKNVIWQDDSDVFVIIGFAHGTVGIGGDIYSVDIDTKEKVLIVDEERVEITDFYIEKNTLYYEGIEYIDENWNEHVEYSNQLSLDEVNQIVEQNQ
jgi:hypothetical protein